VIEFRKIFHDDPLLAGMLAALVGGALRGLHCRPEQFTWYVFLFRVLAAGFVGILAGFLMSYTDLNPRLEAAIIGASGYAAIDLLDYIPRLLKETLRDKVKRL
jgi:hypothetical protein